MNEPKPQYVIPVQVTPIESDEVSIADLVLILIKGKYLIIGVTLLGLVISFAVALTLSEKVTFSTPLEIGGVPPIESNVTALARIEESYIPAESNKSQMPFTVSVRSPQKSEIMVLETTTDPDLKEQVSTGHTHIAEMLITHQNALITERRINKEEQLKELEAQREGQLNNTIIQNLHAEIMKLQKQRLSGTLTTIEKQVLSDNLNFMQVQLRQELYNQQAATSELNDKIRQLQEYILAQKSSKLLNVALSSKRSKKSIPIVTIVGGIAAMIFGVFLAFLVEFISKLKVNRSV